MENELRDLERSLKTFQADALHLSTKEAVKEEKKLTLRVLVHLREIERRNLFYVGVCTSLFEYCVTVLGYSESETTRRIAAMRLMRELPAIEGKLMEGSLNMTGINQARTFFNREEEAAGPISAEKKQEIIEAIQDKTGTQIEKTLMDFSRKPEAHVKKKEGQRAISSKLTQVHFVADEEMQADAKLLRGLLAHKHPSLGWSELVKLALK